MLLKVAFKKKKSGILVYYFNLVSSQYECLNIHVHFALYVM